MFSEGLIDLIEAGVITGRCKSIHPRKVVASFCMGTRRAFDFLHDNPLFEFHPTSYTNDPFVIAQNYKMVSINSALEVDLTGQITADSLGEVFYSGIGGHLDFVRGAARSEGGKPIIAIPSTAKGGDVSRIVPTLSEGAGVVTTRADVHYVVTEYGIAYLHGKSLRERAMALIQIAHPKFRPWLFDEAKRRGIIPKTEKRWPEDGAPYPEGYEREAVLKDGSLVLIRPIKPTDEPKLKEFFYSLSEESIYKRFMQYIRSLPYRERERLTVLDYRSELALVAMQLLPDGKTEGALVGVARYFLNPTTNYAELALIVRDDWQNRGLGRTLLNTLIEKAKDAGIKGFYAFVLKYNYPMLHLIKTSGTNVSITSHFDEYEICFDLEDNG